MKSSCRISATSGTSLNVEYRNIKEESRQKKCSEEEAGQNRPL